MSLVLHQRKALKTKNKKKTSLLVQHNYSKQRIIDCSSLTLLGHLPQNGDLLISLQREQTSFLLEPGPYV